MNKKPNFRAEANRLTGCRLMDSDSLCREIQAALECFYNLGLNENIIENNND